jgi:hypothetical protein
MSTAFKVLVLATVSIPSNLRHLCTELSVSYRCTRMPIVYSALCARKLFERSMYCPVLPTATACRTGVHLLLLSSQVVHAVH